LVDGTIRIPIADLLENDFDADGDEFGLVDIDGSGFGASHNPWVGNGTAVQQGQTIIFSPNPGATIGRFAYAINDGKHVESSWAVVEVHIPEIASNIMPPDVSEGTILIRYPFGDEVQNPELSSGGPAEHLDRDGDGGYLSDNAAWDFVQPFGTTVRSVADGVIVGWYDAAPDSLNNTPHMNTGPGGWGNWVTIQHTAESGATFFATYLHLAQGSVQGFVESLDGDFVETGTPIGLLGRSGNAYGAHLHFQVSDHLLPNRPIADATIEFADLVSFTTLPPNSLPIAVGDILGDDEQIVRQQDGTIWIPIAKLLANDDDPDGDQVSFIDFNGTGYGGDNNPWIGNGTAIRNGNVIVFTPDEGASIGRFAYAVNDGRTEQSSWAVVEIVIPPIVENGAPIWLDITGFEGVRDDGLPLDFISEVGDYVDFRLSDYATDPDGDELTFNVWQLPAGLTFDPDTTRIYGTFTEAANFASFSYSMHDGKGHSVGRLSTWSITEPELNQPPSDKLAPSSLILEFAARIVAYNANEDGWLPNDPEADAPSAAIEAVADEAGYEISDVIALDGFVAVTMISDTGEPIIAIRGSADLLKDWVIANSDPAGVGVTQLLKAWEATGAGSLRSWIADHAAEGIHIVGHSLGGAQAQLLASLASKDGYEIASLSTFNSAGIPDSFANADFNLIGAVHHRISAGDVVSLSGEAFLDGEVTVYDLDTINSISLALSPALHFIRSHSRHWSQADLYDSNFDILGFENRLEDPELVTWIDTELLSDEDYSPIYSNYRGEPTFFNFNVDVQYLIFLRLTDLYSKVLTIDLHGSPQKDNLLGGKVYDILSARGSVEASRSYIGELLRAIDAALGTISVDAETLFEQAVAWATEVAEIVGDIFTVATFRPKVVFDAVKTLGIWSFESVLKFAELHLDTKLLVQEWMADSAKGVAQWGIETLGGVATWSLETNAGMTTWRSDAVLGLLDWSGDALTALNIFKVDGLAELGKFGLDSIKGLASWSVNSIGAFATWSESSIAAAANWGLNTINSLTSWSAASVEGLGAWKADALQGLNDWSSEALEGLGQWGDKVAEMAEWSAEAMANLTLWSYDHVVALGKASKEAIADFGVSLKDQMVDMAEWSADLVLDIAEGGIGVFEALKNAPSDAYDYFYNPEGALDRLINSNEGAALDLEEAFSIPTEIYGAGSTSGSLQRESFKLSTGSDILSPGGGFDLVRLGADSDTIEGSGVTLDGLFVHDFTDEDRLQFVGDTFSMSDMRITMGSAILDIDLNKDGVFDTTVVLEGDYEGAIFSTRQVGNDTIVEVSGSRTGIFEVGSQAADIFDGSPGDDTIFVGAGDDFVSGEAGNDKLGAISGNTTLSGGVDDDLIVGGFDNDILSGDAGNDVIIGDISDFIAGSDSINGGSGDDLLEGGAGADTFIFAVGDGSDTIGQIVADYSTPAESTVSGSDFESGIDKILLGGFDIADGAAALARVSDIGGVATFSDQGTNITFAGLTVADLNSDDFAII